MSQRLSKSNTQCWRLYFYWRKRFSKRRKLTCLGLKKVKSKSSPLRKIKKSRYFHICSFIFIQTSHQNILYYGTRNHSVRRMEIGSWDVLSPFQPPHLDSVTGLTVVGNRLISGSKDKHLRLWSLDQTVSNNKHTFHAFNDYVTTV